MEPQTLVTILSSPDANNEEIITAINAYLATPEHSLSDVLTEDGENALHLAAKYNHADAISYMVINNLVDIELLASNGDTALHIAARKGHMEATEKLIAMGAPTYLENDDGNTADDIAEVAGHTDLAGYIITHQNFYEE